MTKLKQEWKKSSGPQFTSWRSLSSEKKQKQEQKKQNYSLRREDVKTNLHFVWIFNKYELWWLYSMIKSKIKVWTINKINK